jgi:hypothetical protein
MQEFAPFTSDAEIEHIATGLIARTLPKAEWTHAAHFASALCLLSTRSYARVALGFPGYIRAYNESTGTANTDSSGYHETITIASLAAAAFHLKSNPVLPLFESANALLASPLGKSDWLFEYWSRPCLFSVEARRAWVNPDLKPLPFEIP